MKNILKIATIFFWFILNSNSYGQTHLGCGNEYGGTKSKVVQCSQSSLDFLNHYKHKEQYIPHGTNNIIKTLHININIWQRSDGTGNLHNNPQTITRLKDMAFWINYKYQVLYHPIIPVPYPTEFISDSKIRIVLDSIYFYQDTSNDSAYYYGGYGYATYGHNQLLDAFIKTNFPERSNALNIHLTGSVWPMVGGYSDYGSIETFYRRNPDMDTSLIHDFWFASAMAHEIGHSFDLWHTYNVNWEQNCNNSDLDFLWDIYDSTSMCSPSGCKVCLIPGATSTNNNLMGGGDNASISALQMGIIHRSTIMENFHNGNYGVRNHVTGYSSTPYEITKNEVWDFSMKFYQDIIVKSGNTLTIKCEIQFVPNSKIIVEPGAKLIIDGGKLTNEKYYNMLWQGIEVWGNCNQPQESSFSDPNQGIVKIINGTIENAENAITLWHPGDWTSMGGIVDANGATFLNNRRSVEFMAYQNTDPINGITSRNISQFTNCTFKVDGDYRGESTNPFSQHVTLWGVNGVFFTACKFLNEQSNKEYSLSNNKAIYSMDAGYTVHGDCPYIYAYGQSCDPEAIIKSEFKGFNMGINALSSSTSNVVKVEDAVFEENVKGVQYEGLSNSWINRSDFLIGNNIIANTPFTHEGIVTIGSKDFHIEENNLQLSLMPASSNYGIRTRNSEESNSQIYKNSSNGLNIGERAEGVNRDPGNAFNGLKILCNIHSSNIENDIAVSLCQNLNSEGISMYQGMPQLSAGNKFSGGSCDYKNTTNWGIFYYYTGTTGSTNPTTCGSVATILVNTANTCPSNYNNGHGFPLSVDSKIQLNSEYTIKETTYLNLLYNYNNLIDGGNKNLLLEEIEMSWPQDAWELRAELISNSPYLSEEVLREVAMKGVLPQAMLLEICLANPDGARNKEFIEFLGKDIPNPLPQYMLDLIYANIDVSTARTMLEANLSEVASQMAVISNLLISNCMLDSIINKDEARSWLLRRGNISDYYSVAESYIESNNFDNALNYVNQIPDLFKLSKEQQAEHLNFRDYAEFRGSIAESGKNIMQLKDTDIETLQQIAEKTGRASILAQNILCFGYQLCVDYLPIEGEGEQLKSTKPGKTAKEVISAAYNKITATPNPADVYVAFTWELPLLESDAILIITDVNGKSIEQKTITTKRGQWIWDTRTIKKGIYLYEIKTDNERLGNGKLIINN